MEFKFACPHCGQRLSATDDQVGSRSPCPACSNPVRVPSFEHIASVSGVREPVKVKPLWRRRPFHFVAAGIGLILVLFAVLRPHPSRTVTVPVEHLSTAALPKPRTLMIKGLYIGQPLTEAIEAIKAQGNGRISTAPGSHGEGQPSHDILLAYDGSSKATQGGLIYYDKADQRVTAFEFFHDLSNVLFHTADLNGEQFAQMFIDSYGVPKLSVSNEQGYMSWRYESKEGWILTIFPDKRINLCRRPNRKFD